jgi:hypothetical protein
MVFNGKQRDSSFVYGDIPDFESAVVIGHQHGFRLALQHSHWAFTRSLAAESLQKSYRYFDALTNLPLMNVRNPKVIVKVIGPGERNLRLLRLIKGGAVDQFVDSACECDDIGLHRIPRGEEFERGEYSRMPKEELFKKRLTWISALLGFLSVTLSPCLLASTASAEGLSFWCSDTCRQTRSEKQKSPVQLLYDASSKGL